MKKTAKSKRKNLLILLPILVSINLFSCSQEAGDSCFVNNDCDGIDYICCMYSPDASKGTCTLKSECISSDAGTDSDSKDITDTTDATD